MNVGNYAGRVIARLFDADTGKDYTDEATGLQVDLTANMFAVGLLSGQVLVLNINPLTTIAGQVAGLNADGTGTVASDTAVTNANATVAKAFGLSNITSNDPNLTNDATAGANDIGIVLAALSGYDATGSMQTTINTLRSAIVGTGSGATLSLVEQQKLIQAVAVVDPALVNTVSDLLSSSVSGTGFSIGDIATDNIIKPSDALAAGAKITGTLDAGTSAANLALSFGGVAGTGSFVVNGTSWSYTMTAADVTALTAADGSKEVKLSVSGVAKSTRVVLTDMVDSPPIAVTLVNATSSLYENTNLAAGKKVADIVIADSDGYTGGAPTVSNNNFEVKTVNGKYELWLKSTASIDYESVSGESLSTTVTAGGLTSSNFVMALANVNEAPTGANKTLVMNEDTTRSFVAADFGFADAPGETGALSAVIITTLPTAGALKLNNVAVTAGQTVAVADLSKLSFVPAANANGSAYATIGFKVVDDGGTANGGVNTSAAAYTLTIDVTAVNDAPVLSPVTPLSFTDTAAYDTFANQTGTLVGTDVDNDPVTYGIQGGTPGGAFSANGITYDISKAGAYGTLYVVSTGANKGKYLFAPNGTAINALSAAATENFTFTAADAAQTVTQPLTVNLAGANDRPKLVTGFVTDGTPSAGDDDYKTLVIGNASNLTLATAFTDPDTGAGAPIFEVISVNGSATGTIPGLTLNSNGTITGTPTVVANASYPLDYTVVVRAKDAANPALYTDHTFVLHMLKAPVVQSFTVSDSVGNPAIGKSGDALSFSVIFSEPVNVVGTPKITFDIGGTSVIASYSTGTGGATLTFTATAPAGNATSAALASIDLNDGSVTGVSSSQPWTTTVVNQTASYTLDNTLPNVTASYNVNENTAIDTAAKSINLVATDATAISWSTVLAGADANKFTLSSSGVLTFSAATNFEAKSDAGTDGVYDIQATATDAAGNSKVQAITINLKNVNEAPQLVASPPAGFDTITLARSVSSSGASVASHFTDPDLAGAAGTPAMTFQLAGGSSLPAGVTLNSDGTFSVNTSTVAAAGNYTVKIVAKDYGVAGDTASLFSAEQTYTLKLADAPSVTTALNNTVTDLDPRSSIVLSVSEDVNWTPGGTYTFALTNN